MNASVRSPPLLESEEELVKLIGELYELVLEPDKWPLVTRKISDALRAIGGVIYTGSRHDLTNSHFAIVENFSDEHIQEYLDHYITIDPREVVAQSNNMLATYDDIVMPESERRKNEFYDWFRSHGSWYTIGTCVWLDDDTYCTIGFPRTRRQGHVGGGETELYNRLLPHIARVVEIARRLGTIDMRLAAAEQALDRLPFGVALLNLNGRIIYANSATDQTLKDADGLTTRHGRLTAHKVSDNTPLERLVARCVAFPNSGPAAPGGTVAVSRPSGLRPYLVYVSPVAKGSVESVFTIEFPAAVAFITDPERHDETPVAVLKRLYRLTEAEARMASALLDGGDVKAYAEQAGVTLNTARWRLKQIFAKTDCRSQSDLIRLLLSGPGMLRLGSQFQPE